MTESAAQRDTLFGGLILVFAAALVRGFIGAGTTTGRVVVTVLFGTLVIGGTLLWIRRRRRAPWLEISDDHVVLLRPNSPEELRLSKTSGDQLQFVTLGSGRARTQGLKVAGGDTVLPLQFFAKKNITRTGGEHGWRFV